MNVNSQLTCKVKHAKLPIAILGVKASYQRNIAMAYAAFGMQKMKRFKNAF
jgi:hypothetical protein